MARKADGNATLGAPVTESCGRCAEAYGYCMPAHDRSPIGCRCPRRPGVVLLCTERACGEYRKRTERIPKEVTVFLSEDVTAKDAPEKVVPLFRRGEARPWKLVPVSEIPPGGLGSEG